MLTAGLLPYVLTMQMQAMALQTDLVEVVHTLRQVVCIKG